MVLRKVTKTLRKSYDDSQNSYDDIIKSYEDIFKKLRRACKKVTKRVTIPFFETFAVRFCVFVICLTGLRNFFCEDEQNKL